MIIIHWQILISNFRRFLFCKPKVITFDYKLSPWRWLCGMGQPQRPLEFKWFNYLLLMLQYLWNLRAALMTLWFVSVWIACCVRVFGTSMLTYGWSFWTPLVVHPTWSSTLRFVIVVCIKFAAALLSAYGNEHEPFQKLVWWCMLLWHSIVHAISLSFCMYLHLYLYVYDYLYLLCICIYNYISIKVNVNVVQI